MVEGYEIKKMLETAHNWNCLPMDVSRKFFLWISNETLESHKQCSKDRDEDVGPKSVRENGYDLMRGDLEEAVEAQILTPAKGRVWDYKQEKEAFEHGLVFVKFPEILVKGHSAFSTSRLDKMKARAEFSNYIFLPTKFNFRKVKRIIASIFAFSEK